MSIEEKIQATSEKTVQHPLVSFVVPCYNSQDYMCKCVDSLLQALSKTEHVCEILLINDGSSDNTGLIAKEYERNFACVRAIDQENTNWGGVVNRGLELAQGVYFKIVDSDDYLDQNALLRILDTLNELQKQNTAPDLLITNYVYDHTSDKSQHVIQYRKLFPKNRLFTWQDMGKPGIDQFIMVHASWYKTALLRASHLKLPTGVSYMDSLFVLHPLPQVSSLYYLDVDAYHYIIGREGQSVEVEVVKKCIDQQLLASKLAIEECDYAKLYQKEPNQALLMMGYVSCMMSVSTIYLFKINTPEALEKNRQLWAYMQEKDQLLYENVKKSWAGRANRKTALGRTLAKLGYALAQKLFKFA